MNSRVSSNRRTLLAIFIALLVVCEMTAYAINTPRPTEQFFQLYVLGANHMAGNYYSNNETNIQIGKPLTWYLGATNNMGSVQLISIRVKAGNQTINAPDNQQATDSPAPVVTDFERALLDNETWEVSFIWSVSNATLSYGSVRVLMLHINNETYPISDWSAAKGYNFRLIFELWTWQTDSDTFGYGWSTEGEHRSAWLQVWFNMTNPGTILSSQ